MVLFSILLLLLSNAVSVRRDKSILYSRESIIILLYSCIIAINSLDVTCLSKSLMLFNGLFYTSPITHTFHIIIFFISALIIQLTAFHPRKVWNADYSDIKSILLSKFHYYNTNITNKMGQQYKIIEYPLILLFIITGGAFLICCADIVSVFLSIELQSYGLYLLCTLYRNSELSTSAGLTYFLLGGLSSCFILLGSSLLYIYYGTTSLDGYYIINNISNYSYDYYNIDVYKPLYLNTSILILLIGFLFKISAAPFHFWSPDVYDAIPTTVTTFVAIIAKISILVFLFALIQYTAKLDVSYDFNWKYGILFSSFFSLIIGTVLGITQSRIKRLLAYSTISHLGFILLSISISSLDSIQAFIFYLIQYSFSNLNAFLILIAMGYSLYSYIYQGSDKVKVNSLSDKNNSPIQLISQLKGYFHNNVVLALSFAITLFSFVGVPPLLGFFAKQMVLSTALNNGYIYLSIIGIMTSVISAVYYLMIIKQMFFENSDHKLSKDFQDMKYKGLLINEKRRMITFGINDIKITSFLSITISILTLTLTLFILEPSNLLNAVLILGLLTINI